MKTLTIANKMRIGLGIMALLVAVAVGTGFYGANRLSNMLDFITTNAWSAADGAMEGTINIQGEMLIMNDIIADTSDSQLTRNLKKLDETEAETRSAFEGMRNSGLIEAEHLQVFDRHMNAYEDAQKALLKLVQQRAAGQSVSETVMIATRNLYLKNTDTLIETVARLEEVGDGKVEGESANIAAIQSFVFTSLVIVSILSVIFIVAVAYISANAITTPIKNAAEQLRRIAEVDGDLTVELPVKSQDEIGQLSQYFNAFVGKLRGTIGDVAGTTTQITQASGELAVIAEETSHNVSQQQSETQQVATAVNEMSATVEEVARNAGDAAQSAQQADSEANTGRTLVSNMRQMIIQLSDQMNDTSDVIDGLRTETQNIGSVLDVIKGIAEQTNLLALNAAIEAARAGEQGRGFAVVADEVRTLATRTQQSTEEIQEMIERLQKGAEQAVGAMEQSSGLTISSAEKSSEAESSLTTITSMIASINDMNTQISAATEQQSAVAQEISRNITNINSAAENVTNTVQQTTNSSENLASLAHQLQNLINQFKV